MSISRGRLKKKRPDPRATYQAWQSFTTATVSVARGDRLRGDDPIVLANFGFFVDERVPAEDWPTPWDRIVVEDEQRATEHEAQRKAHAAAYVICIQQVREPASLPGYGPVGYVTRAEVGDRLLKDDPLVKEHPKHFEQANA